MRAKFTKAAAMLVVVFALGAVAASAASAAAPEWQLNGKAITKGIKIEGKWVGTTKLKLTDNRLGVVLSCEGYTDNIISTKTVETTATNWTSCTISSGGECTVGDNVTDYAEGLPWTSELYEEGGKLRQRTKGSGGKAVGWKFTCTVAGEQWTNECTASSLTAGLSDVTGGVDVAFDSLTPALKCTGRGYGNETGSVEGTELYKNPEKETLTVT